MTRSLAPGVLAIAGIGVIVAAILFGPLVSPPEFSWVQHSTSEQAGQLMPGAWTMRAGFVSYGLGTVVAALLDRSSQSLVRVALAVFGLGLLGTAVWSNAAIIPDVVSDMREDWIHSVFSGLVGVAFASACAAKLFGPGGSRHDKLAWTGLFASTLLPIGMGAFPDIRGLIQRLMFAISFFFVGREFTRRS